MALSVFPWKNKGEGSSTPLNRQNLNAAEEALAAQVTSGAIPLPSSVVSGSALGATSVQPAALTAAEAAAVTRATTALNFVTDFGGKGDARFHKVETTNESITVSFPAGVPAEWLNKVICGENIPAGTTITAVASTTFTISKAATGTNAASKVFIGSDNSAAWEAYWAAVTPEGAPQKAAASPGNILKSDATVLFQHELYQPAGIYLTTKPEAMMKAVAPPRTGLHWRGAGRNLTYNVYAPTEANSAMMRNTEALQRCIFEDMTFGCLDSTATFMASVGPIAQNYIFNRCLWTGSWKYGIRLTGTNNNSEFSFWHCGIRDRWTAFFSSPSEAEGGSDQFLNFSFWACQIEPEQGNFIDMASGGSINVYGGSLLHTGNGSEEQIFFALRGKTHSGGTPRLNVDGVRIEHRHARSKLLFCEWESGVVSVRQYDGSAVLTGLPTSTEIKTECEGEAAAGSTSIKVKSSTGFTVGMQVTLSGGLAAVESRTITEVPDSTHIVLNAATSFAHPNLAKVEQAIRKYLIPVEIKYAHDLIVHFEDCLMPGTHRYGYENSISEYHRRVLYTASRALDWEYADEFIQSFSNDGSNNEGNKTPVVFEMCKGLGSVGAYKRVFDTVVNSGRSALAQPRARELSFKQFQGQLPSTASSTTLEAFLPKSAIITRVRSWKGATGTNTAKNWVYKLLDMSNSEAVIAEVGGGGTVEWKTGWSFDSGTLFKRPTGEPAKWGIKLVAENVAEGTGESFFIVDYIC